MRLLRFARLALVGTVVVTSGWLVNPAYATDTATVAWLRDGKVEIRALGGPVTSATESGSSKLALGSLWKLFVYAYLTDSKAQEPAYVCAAKSPLLSEDRYCCEPGASVSRDSALARSCAPYFAPKRLGIDQRHWQAYWQSRTHASWLLDIKRMQPQTEVTLSDLLTVLAQISPQARTQARSALLETGVAGYGREAWIHLGSGIRYKTYSWHRADGSPIGGAAGWLADGTPFWFGAYGASRSALTTWSVQLAAALPSPRWRNVDSSSTDSSCVDVDFFTRYPLQAVWQANVSEQVKSGVLNGRYRLQFANGNWLNILTKGDIRLIHNTGTAPAISGRFSINDYVARVIDREGNANSSQAARALAIAARSYMLQNAHFQGGCWRIADASNTQRVSPNMSTDAALAAAWFTDDMILQGASVHYHQTATGNNRMAWHDAVTQDRAGWDFERILSASYPQATLATMSGRAECARLDAAESWLTNAAAGWQTRLAREPGFEALDTMPKICELADGHPYSDQQRMRIYVRGWRSLNDRITLAHEYLHLALRFHPHGADEDYVEKLARRLIED